MRPSLALAAAFFVATPLAAQQNPFALPKSKPVYMEYQSTGDMTGNGAMAISGDRIMTRSTSTGKFFGHTSTVNNWMLVTPDSMYSADLTKKTGTVAPNMMHYMAKEYDGLDKDAKARLHQNMADMASMMAQVFGASSLTEVSAATQKKTYAGAECDERTVGSWSICTLHDAPQISLHTQGQFLCVNFEQTATTVKYGDVPSSAFEMPAGITFQQTKMEQSPDSAARVFVRYLASQELADSLAKAKSELQQQQASAASNGTPAQPASLQMDQKTCETLKNLDLGKMMADAMSSVVKEAAGEVVQEKKAEAKQKAKGKLKGLFGKPHLP
ncbi:MAG TPA: hypothetical protein VFK13_13020 [Gemmatimonadaceae bacterium]|nr:hypothetical protein [Gemmatimonadaceae bacterium]